MFQTMGSHSIPCLMGNNHKTEWRNICSRHEWYGFILRTANIRRSEAVNLYFSNLWVNNREVVPNDDTGLLKEALPFTRHLKLNHKQSILKFEFSSDNITALDRYRYQYRIKVCQMNGYT